VSRVRRGSHASLSVTGPTVCQFLAELGATVVKVENSSTGGDVTRSWVLPSESAGESTGNVTAYFTCCNLGKKSIAVDVRNGAGLDCIQKLAAQADVVVASYKPGDAEKLELDQHTLRALNPGLVYASISGYGSEDPRAGYDAVIQAESGFQYMNGQPGTAPTKMPVALMDLLAAHQLKEAVLVALWDRDRHNGLGSHVEVSLLGAGVSALANQATGYLVAGKVPERMGSDHPSICPYGTIFAAADGKLLVLAVGANSQFHKLCAVLGVAHIASDDRFATNQNRVVHRTELLEVLAERMASPDVAATREALLAQLRAVAVPVGPVNDMEAVFEQPQAQELVVGETRGIRQVAFKRDNGPERWADLSAPPRYAQHTAEILIHKLGLTGDLPLLRLLNLAKPVQLYCAVGTYQAYILYCEVCSRHMLGM
jgi:crotonobetainyl-CoA:carnitine CoA-transferase CaiB-like acyl-CoA transferase